MLFHLLKPVRYLQEEPEYGSANSKEKLVTKWLGRHHAVTTIPLPPRSKGVRKARKPPPGPMMLVPAHPASTVRLFNFKSRYSESEFL